MADENAKFDMLGTGEELDCWDFIVGRELQRFERHLGFGMVCGDLGPQDACAQSATWHRNRNR